MNARITEFQCIMPLENIPSVLKLGILSNERSAKIEHHSVAMEDVQEKRELKHVPGGLKLHQYANLYFHARNPMLYKRKGEINNLCILRISTEIMTWRTITGKELVPPGSLQLETLLKGVFEKARLLDLVRNFIVFEDDGEKVTKKLAG